ncbi:MULTISPECIES: hypothetical protein [unclassified Olsenella]|uniref:hypothetical protein n=1 Tax=unclassified Olsenella TaxID=2638792 RepID=UPI0011C1BBF6|nr:MULTISPECIES: hypothetical protein [unclassified Olsenella]
MVELDAIHDGHKDVRHGGNVAFQMRLVLKARYHLARIFRAIGLASLATESALAAAAAVLCAVAAVLAAVALVLEATSRLDAAMSAVFAAVTILARRLHVCSAFASFWS